MSNTGERVGTVGYAPPEYLDGSEIRNENFDLWSLGMLLFILVVGHPPFS